jgi:hypothetical protein
VTDQPDRRPWRIRHRVPLTFLPPLAGVAVAVPLWGSQAEPAFFSAAINVLALGAIGMALTGHFFRLEIHRGAGVAGVYAIVNVLVVLVVTGIGLFYSFRTLALGTSGHEDLAMVSASLATGVCAFTIQAMFGTPGLEEEPTGEHL